MQLSGRPLLDNAVDQALFVGRDRVLHRIEQSLRTNLNCLVVGDPGSGKTSLVRALMFRSHRSGSRTEFSYVRVNEAGTAADLLAAVLARARRESVTAADLRMTPADLLDALTAEFEQGLPAESRVIVVEDVPAAAGADVFGSLRDELWQVDARWVVTTSSTQAPGLLRPPADVFFETSVELEPLSAQDASDLLRRRIDAPDTVKSRALLAAVIEATPSTPRRLLELARELTADPTVGAGRLTTVRGLKARTAALEQVSRPARMLANELDAVGWAGASDERLLARMGWTRPRVVQVIAELEDRGLVQMREENTGRGRPRKLYRLTPAAEFAGSEPAEQGAARAESVGAAEPDTTTGPAESGSP